MKDEKNVAGELPFADNVVAYPWSAKKLAR